MSLVCLMFFRRFWKLSFMFPRSIWPRLRLCWHVLFWRADILWFQWHICFTKSWDCCRIISLTVSALGRERYQCSQCHKFSAENVHVLVKLLHRKNACVKHWCLINVCAYISFICNFLVNVCYKVSFWSCTTTDLLSAELEVSFIQA